MYTSEAFKCLSVPVLDILGEFNIHHNRCTAGKAYRKQGAVRADWVWVRRQPKSKPEKRCSQLDGMIPARLNCLLKVRDKQRGMVHRLAHVSLLTYKGSTKPHGEEGMLQVRVRAGRADHVVRIADIEGIAHLIPLESQKVWLVNNRIDLNTWNDLFA